MEIFPLAKENERAAAFEVENVYVSRKSLVEILRQAKGVTNIELRGRFSSSDDIRVEFKYHDRNYIVMEPFGDNSRYWIGPKNPRESVPDITDLENSFKRYEPPFHRAVLGDLLTLRMFKRFAGPH